MIGGKLLRRVGQKLAGQVVTRVQARLSDRFEVTGSPDPTAPAAVVRAWEPPPWLDLILRLLRAILDRFVPR